MWRPVLDRDLSRAMLAFALPLVPAAVAGWTLNLADRPLLQVDHGQQGRRRRVHPRVHRRARHQRARRPAVQPRVGGDVLGDLAVGRRPANLRAHADLVLGHRLRGGAVPERHRDRRDPAAVHPGLRGQPLHRAVQRLRLRALWRIHDRRHGPQHRRPQRHPGDDDADCRRSLAGPEPSPHPGARHVRRGDQPPSPAMACWSSSPAGRARGSIRSRGSSAAPPSSSGWPWP